MSNSPFHTRRVAVLLVMSMLLPAAITPAATTSTTDCSHVTTIMDNAGQVMVEQGATIYGGYVKKEDRSALEECLGSIGGGQIINLGIPDLDQLLAQACSMIRGEISSHLSSTNKSQSISVLDGTVTVGQSSGSGTNGNGIGDGVKVSDTSGSVRNAVWRSIQ